MLANYVARGRAQALLVAVICAGIPLLFWMSATVIGLVTLRQGIAEGTIILLWAMLPAGVMMYLGEVVPIVVLVGTVLMAGLLRATASWQLVLLACTVLGLLFGGGLMTIGRDYTAMIESLFGEFFSRLYANSDPAAVRFEAPDALDIAGMFGLVQTFTLVNCLLMSRWCQAMLDHPGGFRREFLALRIEVLPMVVLITVAAGVIYTTKGIGVWAWLLLLPLLFAGIALIHAAVANRGVGPQWLVLMYVGLILLPPVKYGLVGLAALDSWINLRNRYKAST